MQSLAAVLADIDSLVKENQVLKQQIADMEWTGAQRPNRPKLSTRDVSNIKDLKRSGYTQADIAEIYDINPATVSRIVRGAYHK